jgi:hypothetical protein
MRIIFTDNALFRYWLTNKFGDWEPEDCNCDTYWGVLLTLMYLKHEAKQYNCKFPIFQRRKGKATNLVMKASDLCLLSIRGGEVLYLSGSPIPQYFYDDKLLHGEPLKGFPEVPYDFYHDKIYIDCRLLDFALVERSKMFVQFVKNRTTHVSSSVITKDYEIWIHLKMPDVIFAMPNFVSTLIRSAKQHKKSDRVRIDYRVVEEYVVLEPKATLPADLISESFV